MPIFDQGYQHWSGQLSGHAWRWLAITRHGVRIGLQSRILRLLLLVAWLPAVVLAGFLCVWGLIERKSELVAPLLPILAFLDPQVIENPLSYRVEMWTLSFEYFLLIELRLSMILVLVVGPSLISQDLRFNALPLYFSRPVRRFDYFIGKLGVIGVFLGLVLLVPSLIAYGLGFIFSLDISILRDTMPLLLSSLAYGVVMVLSTGALILALSSLSRNSRYTALFWLALWFVSGIVGAVLDTVDQQHRRHAHYQQVFAARRAQGGEGTAKTPEQRRQEQREFQASLRRAEQEFRAEEQRAARQNWRPLVSYTANLARVGRFFLNSDACWERLSQNRPEADQPRFLQENAGPQYPWYWSAIVLAVLFGLSACILNFRIRSLDRLK